MLYFENLSGVKEDEYFRDGITEDIITELSKIKGLKIFSRPTVLAYRDKVVTPRADRPAALGARTCSTAACGAPATGCGSTRSSIDTRTDFPLWSERYDREMEDVFEVQDEIARKIAEALRITLTPQEQAALAAKPTDNLQAYDLYLRGKSYARRLTRQDLEFACQMFENAVVARSGVRAGLRRHGQRLRAASLQLRPRAVVDGTRAKRPPSRPRRCGRVCRKSHVAHAWVLYAGGAIDEAIQHRQQAIARKPDCEGGYYLLGRALFSVGRYQELADIAETAIRGRRRGLQRLLADPERARRARQDRRAAQHPPAADAGARRCTCKGVPEDVRARDRARHRLRDSGRTDDAMREVNLAMLLRPDEASVLYNAACAYCRLNKKAEAIDVLAKAQAAGFGDSDWARRDPDLALLHGEPEFEKLYPETT